jgi:phage protein D
MSLPVQTDPRTAGSQVRKPFLKVQLNGSVILPAYSAEVMNASHFTSDTFHTECALSDMPPGYDASYWSESVNDRVQIWMGTGTGDAAPFILGQVDNAKINPIRKILTLTGRDLSAVFLDNETTEKFQNLTSSQIALKLAARRGLQANVAPTKGYVGTYYSVDKVDLTRKESEWDLLIFLAQHEGFDLWVSGNTLNFQPSLDLSKLSPYLMIYADDPQGGGKKFSNLLDLDMDRSQTLARDIIVTVRSWNQYHEKPFTVIRKRQHPDKGQRAGGKAQNYTFTVPNLDEQGAINYATQKLEEISRHERVIDAWLAGDDTLNIRMPIQLVGTGTSFDQEYYPDTITRSISFGNYTMKVRAKNHSTESTVIL